MASKKGFMYHLSFATCEWFLMFLMFIDAALAYILTKFAQYCELQRPCLFCLRLDHLFGNEEPGLYLSLFCSKHRAEISSLVSCDRHDKLADVREMCEDCFMSVTMQNQSNNVESSKFERNGRSFLNKNFVRVPSSTGTCSCCKRQWKAKTSAQRLIQPSAVGLGASKVTVKPPLPRVLGRSRFSSRYTLKRMRDKVSGTMTPQRAVSISSLESLPDICYTELKITLDSESEVPFSDDDASFMGMVLGGKRGSMDDSAVIHGTDIKNQDVTRARYSYCASDPGLIHVDGNLSRATSLTSNSSFGHDLGELNLEKLETKFDNSPLPEPVSHDTCPPSNNAVEFPLGASPDKFSAPSEPHDMEISTKQRKLSNNEGKEFGAVKVKAAEDLSTNIRSDVSNLDEIHDPLASDYVDKNDGYESFGGSSVSEIESESIVEKLRRQVRYDRKRIKMLQAEIEEERNAAAEAANQAMAMITRLQEEKAALHMEALQYLRMMEEQAEYDTEALQKANDLVAEKDKEIQDLVAELEFFMDHYDHMTMMGNAMAESGNSKTENGKIDANSSSDFKPLIPSAQRLDLEDEKKYILQRLSELEKQFHQFSSRHTSIGTTTTEELQDDRGTQTDQGLSTSNGNISDDSKKRVSIDGGIFDLGALENEISVLNERLEALEADRDFLERACNTLHNGGGLQFIQEIAHHLQDLRRNMFDRKCLLLT